MATVRRTRVEGRTAAPFRTAKTGTKREFGLTGPVSFPAETVIRRENGAVKRLYILRHAKSSWDEEGLPDHERPLAPRGEKAAARIAEHMRSEGIAPELVLCSTALRTRQTLAVLLPVLPGDVVVVLEDELYGASLEGLIERLREVDEVVSAVLVIGHNPTLHALALALTGQGDALDRFPTGALATVGFFGPWADLGEGAGELEALVVPREL